jgi:hypothetical protein
MAGAKSPACGGAGDELLFYGIAKEQFGPSSRHASSLPDQLRGMRLEQLRSLQSSHQSFGNTGFVEGRQFIGGNITTCPYNKNTDVNRCDYPPESFQRAGISKAVL